MASSLNTARAEHTATLLSNGEVLVAGGSLSGSALTSAELYDPASGSFTETGSLNQARTGHTATLLPNGSLLLAGGENQGNALVSAEVYDPATGSFTLSGSLSEARSGHTATLLPSGQVLLVGGVGVSGTLASAELYDSVTGSFTATGNLKAARSQHTALLLPNGKVLVVGGKNSDGEELTRAEIYNPATGMWSRVIGLDAARSGHVLTLLPDGRVLAAGGTGAGGELASVELFDSGLGFKTAWQPTLDPVPAAVSLSNTLRLTGSGFTGFSEAASGDTQQSATNAPLVQLRSLANDQVSWLPLGGWTETSIQVRRVEGVPPGYAVLTIFVNGIPSEGYIVQVRPFAEPKQVFLPLIIKPGET